MKCLKVPEDIPEATPADGCPHLGAYVVECNSNSSAHIPTSKLQATKLLAKNEMKPPKSFAVGKTLFLKDSGGHSEDISAPLLGSELRDLKSLDPSDIKHPKSTAEGRTVVLIKYPGQSDKHKLVTGNIVRCRPPCCSRAPQRSITPTKLSKNDGATYRCSDLAQDPGQAGLPQRPLSRLGMTYTVMPRLATLVLKSRSDESAEPAPRLDLSQSTGDIWSSAEAARAGTRACAVNATFIKQHRSVSPAGTFIIGAANHSESHSTSSGRASGNNTSSDVILDTGRSSRSSATYRIMCAVHRYDNRETSPEDKATGNKGDIQLAREVDSMATNLHSEDLTPSILAVDQYLELSEGNVARLNRGNWNPAGRRVDAGPDATELAPKVLRWMRDVSKDVRAARRKREEEEEKKGKSFQLPVIPPPIDKRFPAPKPDPRSNRDCGKRNVDGNGPQLDGLTKRGVTQVPSIKPPTKFQDSGYASGTMSNTMVAIVGATGSSSYDDVTAERKCNTAKMKARRRVGKNIKLPTIIRKIESDGFMSFEEVGQEPLTRGPSKFFQQGRSTFQMLGSGEGKTPSTTKEFGLSTKSGAKPSTLPNETNERHHDDVRETSMHRNVMTSPRRGDVVVTSSGRGDVAVMSTGRCDLGQRPSCPDGASSPEKLDEKNACRIT